MQYSAIQYITIHYNTIQCTTLHYTTLQYSAIQHGTMHYNAVQCSTVLYDREATAEAAGKGGGGARRCGTHDARCLHSRRRDPEERRDVADDVVLVEEVFHGELQSERQHNLGHRSYLHHALQIRYGIVTYPTTMRSRNITPRPADKIRSDKSCCQLQDARREGTAGWMAKGL